MSSWFSYSLFFFVIFLFFLQSGFCNFQFYWISRIYSVMFSLFSFSFHYYFSFLLFLLAPSRGTSLCQLSITRATLRNAFIVFVFFIFPFFMLLYLFFIIFCLLYENQSKTPILLNWKGNTAEGLQWENLISQSVKDQEISNTYWFFNYILSSQRKLK